MKPQEYDSLVEKINSDLKKIRATKSHDYASNEDTLRNFKVTATILGNLGFQVKGEEIKSSDVAMFFEVIKLCRRANLRGRQPDNESVLDSVEDNVNYTCLQYACLVDEDNKGINKIKDEVKTVEESCLNFDSDNRYVEDYRRFKKVNDELAKKYDLREEVAPPPVIEKPNWKLHGFWSFDPCKRYFINGAEHSFVNIDNYGSYCFINHMTDTIVDYTTDWLKCSVIEEG